jgi:hypothetical protein
LSVVSWQISPVGPGENRTIYAEPNEIQGIGGVNSYVRGGVARNIWFGPGPEFKKETRADREPLCKELWELQATVNHNGMIANGYGTIQLSPKAEENNIGPMIFLRLADNQPSGEKTSQIINHLIFADGTMESLWEVLAEPWLDTDRGTDPYKDSKSGVYFYEAARNIGGLVPSLGIGQIVEIKIQVWSRANYEITTTTNVESKTINSDDMPKDSRGFSILSTTSAVELDTEDGLNKAKFKIKAWGEVKGNNVSPDPLSKQNLIYSADSFPSSAILKLNVSTNISTNGKTFSAKGGAAAISLTDPLYRIEDGKILMPYISEED